MRSFILIRDPIHGTERVLDPDDLVLAITPHGLEPAEASTLNIGEAIWCSRVRWIVRQTTRQEAAA